MIRPRVSRTSQMSENITDLLSCPVCLEIFDEGPHHPKLLPCHHSFCTLCLERMVTRDQQQLICPTCRQTFKLTVPGPAGICALQTNFYVTRMKDLLDESAIKVKGCRKHENKDLTYFCMSCEVQICPDCCHTEHKDSEGHSTAILAIARDDQVRMLEAEVTEAKEHILFNRDYSKKLQYELEAMISGRNWTLQDVRKEFHNLHALLEERQKEIENKVTLMHKEKSTPLHKRISDYSKEENALQGLLEQCQDAKQNGGISDIIAYRAKLFNKNREIRDLNITGEEIGSNFLEINKHSFDNLTSSLALHENMITAKKLPCIVHFNEYHRIIAGLFTSMSFTVSSFDKEPLEQLLQFLDVEIRDVHDDQLPCFVNEIGDGRYEMTFRPEISGAHKAKVTFCTTGVIKELNLVVHSNNPCAVVGEYGSLEGQTIFPRDLAIDRDNNMFLVDTGNNRIQKFDKHGQFLLDFPLASENNTISSCGIAWDSTRNLLICPEVNMHEADLTHADALLFYSVDGLLKKRLAMSDFLKQALSVSVNSLGQTIIADRELNSVFILDKHGRIKHRFGEKGSGPGEFSSPTFVCVGDKDNIIVSDGDNHRIQVFDKKGNFLLQFGRNGTGKGEFNMPFGVTSDSHGNILVVDGGNKRIQVFKQGGDFVGCIESLGDKMSAPRGISVTNDGYVLVVDRDNHCVKKFKYLLCSSV